MCRPAALLQPVGSSGRGGAGQVLSITISAEAVDPSDVEGLQDLVLAGVNEALRAASAKVEAKAAQMQSELLGGLGLGG